MATNSPKLTAAVAILLLACMAWPAVVKYVHRPHVHAAQMRLLRSDTSKTKQEVAREQIRSKDNGAKRREERRKNDKQKSSRYGGTGGGSGNADQKLGSNGSSSSGNRSGRSRSESSSNGAINDVSNDAASGDETFDDEGETPDGTAPKRADETAASAADEAPDVVVDVGHLVEHPGGPIYDTGRERQERPSEPTQEGPAVQPAPAEGKAEMLENDAFTLEAIDLDGPLPDFIAADLSRATVTTSITCKNSDEGLWKMDLTTDLYPWETSWEMRGPGGNVVASGPPEGRNYARSTRYAGQLCLPAGRYTLRVEDKNGDGMCCRHGEGGITAKVNGRKVAETDDSPFGAVEYVIPVTRLRPGPDPTKRPTPRPTPLPTDKPIRLNQNDLKCVEVEVRTDNWGYETSYQFVDADGSVILEKGKNSMESNKTYRDQACVEDGTYRLTVSDTFQGIQGKGYFAVEVEGERVMYGSRFEEKEASYDIKVGYEEPMNANERGWLHAHNRRRREYHEANGKVYQPLVWNADLAKQSSKWVDKILPTCKIVREPGLQLGENISARSSGGVRDEGAEAIVARWTNTGRKGYPLNRPMTQVYWYATRQVGCAEKSFVRENGTRCYVSICRYARAGNCAVRQYPTWEQATLADRTPCGPVCVNDECY